MEVGQLRQRVSVEVQTQHSDGHDGFVQSWSPVRRRLPAMVTALAGRELERARQIDPRAGYEVTLRFWRAYPEELTARARLIYHDEARDRVLEPVEPPREVEPRVTLVVTCRAAA